MKNKLRRISFILWIFSCITFVVLLLWIISPGDKVKPLDATVITWLCDICFGIIAFIVFVATFIFKGKKIDSFKKSTHTNISSTGKTVFLSIMGTLIVIALIYIGLDYIKLKNNIGTPQQPSVIITNTPSTQIPVNINTNVNSVPLKDPKITCTGPDGKQFQTTQKDCDAFNKAWSKTPQQLDPNEYIKCNINPACGGGYKEMTRASCDQMVCCIQLDNTAISTSRDQCNRSIDQSLDQACSTACNSYDNPNLCDNQTGSAKSLCLAQMSSYKTECLGNCYK